MRKVVLALLILSTFILQSTLFRAIAFAGIGPNLMITLTAAFGFMRGEKEGMWIGFFLGLLQDLFFGQLLGFHALVYLYFGFLNGKFSGIFYPEDIKLPLALITVSDLSYGLVYYILNYLLRGRFEFGYYFGHVIFPEAIYTIVVTMLFYPLILAINRKLEFREQRRAKKFV
jgi:rod shape-determining protein MreD